jgi:hypothetical protein
VDLLFGAAWTCDLVGCRLLIAVWAWFFLGCYSGGLLVVVWTWACGSTSLVTVWWNWTCCPTRSGGPVTPLSSFIISDFFFFFFYFIMSSSKSFGVPFSGKNYAAWEF